MVQTFEDLVVEKEVVVRRRIAKEYVPQLNWLLALVRPVAHLTILPLSLIATPSRKSFRFNKRREDFSDLRSYNDYLEQVEEIGACRRTSLNYPLF